MRERFWELPGPHRLAHAVLCGLLAGDSIVLRQPEWAPDLTESLIAALPAHRRCMLISDKLGSPEARLVTELELSAGQTLDNCAEPHSEPVVIVRGVRGERLRSWARMIRRHYHATRDKPCAVRLLLVADALEPLDREDLGATPVIEWRDVMGRLDMHLYSALLWNGRELSLLERELCVVQTREIAGFCPEVAERVAREGPRAAFEPTEILHQIAQERGWGRTLELHWANGSEDWRDGIQWVHSAAIVARGAERDLLRRLWRGQIEVLFPTVELIRAELATMYQDLLTDVPDTVRPGCRCDPLDVDVGPLAHRLLSGRGVRSEHRRLARTAAEIRRSIAHRQPVNRATALRPELVRFAQESMRLPTSG